MIRNLILGNKRLQKFWWLMYKVAIKGLNYDRGHVPSANGESFAAKYVLSKLNKREPVIFDIGANRGQYLEMFMGVVSQPVRMYCFEPQVSAYRFLEKVAANYPSVRIENLGFSDTEKEQALYRNTEASEYASLYPARYTQYNVELDKSEMISLTTLDAYCRKSQIDTIDFLKIDVEGAELSVLKGACKMINAGKIPFIQFEFGLASLEARIYLKDIMGLLGDYDIFRILPSGLAPIHYSEYHELFLTTNYLASRKARSSLSQ